MSDLLEQRSSTELEERVAQLEARLAQIETQLAHGLPVSTSTVVDPAQTLSAASAHAQSPRPSDGDGVHSGFALAGVAALTLGVGYMLTLPFTGLPALVPGAVGTGLCVALLSSAHLVNRTRPGIALYVRGAAMILLFLSTLRLAFPTRPFSPAPDNVIGTAILALGLVANACVAWRNGSPWLLSLAYLLGCVGSLVHGSPMFLLTALPVLAAGAVLAMHRFRSPALAVMAIPLNALTYFIWSTGNALRGGSFHYVHEPALAPWYLLFTTLVFAAPALMREDRSGDDNLTNTSSLLNCVMGYAVLLVHSAAAFPRQFAALHLATAVMYLGVAVLFRCRHDSRVSTFLYAMTAYFALSMAIIKVAAVPDVYGWLSLQSVIVVATAVWFRSRLIVIANFVIFVAIVLAYVFLVTKETGVSFGFGAVALLSARILHWQKDRLELQTEMMRNAYLATAFVVFPYALHHLVARQLVPLAWVGLSVVYYVVTGLTRNPKYRWMAHGTLGLTALYLTLGAGGRLEPAYRVASFLALGTVLLAVALLPAREKSSPRI
jgi:hypothetical protein